MSDVIMYPRANKDTGSINPTVLASGDTGGIDWTNTSNVLSIDSNVADATLASGIKTNYVVLYGFNFSRNSVPNTATITGIEFKISKSGDLGVRDDAVRLYMDDTIQTAVNRAKTTLWPSGHAGCVASDIVTTYGDSTDMWGLANVNPNNINDDASFGLAFSAKNSNASGDARAYLDGISAKVYYTFAHSAGNVVTGVNKFGEFRHITPTINKSPASGVTIAILGSRFDDITYYTA